MKNLKRKVLHKTVKRTIACIVSLVMISMFCIPVYAEETSENPPPELMEFVNTFMERRADVLIEPIKDVSPLMIGSSQGIGRFDGNTVTVRESDKVFLDEETTLNELDARRDVLSQWDEEYDSYEKELTLLDATISEDSAILVVEEFSKLYYKKIHGDEPEYTAWVVEREFIFAKDSQGWTLLSQQLINELYPAPINEATGVTKNEMIVALTQNSLISAEDDAVTRALDAQTESIDTIAMSRGAFNGKTAAAYAVHYYQNYNPAYRSYAGSGNGGDCTNFVSQAMRAGGWTDVPGLYTNAQSWWYNSLNQTYSWVNVHYFHDFALIYSKRTTSILNPRNLNVGDVLQIDFTNNNSKDHTMIVTLKSSTEIYLTYHTVDTLDRSYGSLCASYPSASFVAHMVKQGTF